MDLRQRIWNVMGPERRQAAAEDFWGDPGQKPFHAQGIRHENGHYELEASAEPASSEALETAVQVLREKYRHLDVTVYLGALVLQDAGFWANLRPIAERMLSEAEREETAPAERT